MAKEKTNTYKIRTIEQGIVIDHVPAGKALEVIAILGIGSDYKSSVSVAMNVPSKKEGKKDLLKVENKTLGEDEINRISLTAPNATINYIRDARVVKKLKVSVPDSLVGVIRCENPNCVTNKEREPVVSRFNVIGRRPLRLRCAYCEREQLP